MWTYLSPAMLGVLGGWCLVAAVCVGWGALLLRAAGARQDEPDRVIAAFWVGYAVVLGFLQAWHLGRPVDWLGSLLIVAVGLVGVGLSARALLALLRRTGLARCGVAALLAAPPLMLLANHACGPCEIYDTGLYHLPVMHWNLALPAVPGLANLHGRFGFNNSNLLYSAWLARLFGDAFALAVGSSALLAGLAVTALRGFWLAWCGTPDQRPRAAASTLLVLPLADYVFRQHVVVGASSDVAGATLVLVSVVALLALREAHSTPAARHAWLLLATCTVAAAVTVKLSNVAYALVAGPLAVWLWWRQIRSAANAPLRWRRPLVFGAAATAFLAAGWLGRGYMLSGYPAYPATVGGLGTAWQVPPEHARYMQGLIANWAALAERHREGVTGGERWRVWFVSRLLPRAAFWTAPGPLLLAALFTGAAACRARRAGFRLWPYLPFAAALLAGCLFWLCTAPDPRLGAQFFWGLAALGAAIAAARVAHASAPAWRTAVAALLLIGILPAAHVFAEEVARGAIRSPRTLIWSCLRTPAPGGGLRALPTAAVRSFVTWHGLQLWVPDDGDQCWGAPLPCTPMPQAGLVLRAPADLAGGFMVEAEQLAARGP